MRNASGQQSKNEWQRKKKGKTATYNSSSIKRLIRKFHVAFVQNNGNEMYKKVCCTCKVVCR